MFLITNGDLEERSVDIYNSCLSGCFLNLFVELKCERKYRFYIENAYYKIVAYVKDIYYFKRWLYQNHDTSIHLLMISLT